MSYKNNKKVGYIRYNDRMYQKFREKLLNIIRKILIKVIIEYVENGIIILIPKYKWFNKLNYSKFIKTRIINQINKYISCNNIEYVVFEKRLQFMEKQFDNINILNGKYLMKNMVFQILEYVLKIKNKNIKLENIYIFVNEYTKNNISIIEMLSRKCKTVNIVTENLRYFRRLEEFLYNEGILITVSNNKRKSAKNAEIIINMDFSKEKLERYNINLDSIIVNITNEKCFFENTFRGVLINNFEISISEDFSCFCNEFYGKIDEKIYLESFILNKDYRNVENQFKQCSGKISGILGIRGKIQDF